MASLNVSYANNEPGKMSNIKAVNSTKWYQKDTVELVTEVVTAKMIIIIHFYNWRHNWLLYVGHTIDQTYSYKHFSHLWVMAESVTQFNAPCWIWNRGFKANVAVIGTLTDHEGYI